MNRYRPPQTRSGMVGGESGTWNPKLWRDLNLERAGWGRIYISEKPDTGGAKRGRTTHNYTASERKA